MSKRIRQIEWHAEALSRLAIYEGLATAEINTDAGAVSWRRADVPMFRENETLRIAHGKIERF